MILALLPFHFRPVRTVQAAAGCTGKVCTYLPILSNRVSAVGDLQITAVEVTQGVQNAGNNVPLVAGRTTVLRIYAQGQNALPAGSNHVQVAISPSPIGPATTSEPFEVVGALQAAPNRAQFASTINFSLPVEWTSGSYDLSITLDPQNQVAEANESNNTFVQHVSFTPVPALRVKIVPVRYTHTDGHTYPAPTRDTISSWIMRLYPVSDIEISWHAPFNYKGNMKDVTSFSDLLSQINAIKKSEGAPPDQVYYALVPTSDGSLNWFSGGVVGIGYVGSRIAVGLDYYNAGLTAAHEIGHNLGRQHAPCGSVSSPDPSFPYADASIGEFGLDLLTSQIYEPGASRDLMSYCSPKWISDYTYRALLQAQLRVGAATAAATADVQPGQVLMIRAQVGPEGASLAPVYAANGLVDFPAPESPYHLQLLGGDGQVLSDTPVQALAIAREDDLPAVEIQANLLRPEGTVHEVRLMQAGAVLATSLLDGPQSTSTLRASVTNLNASFTAAGTQAETGRPAQVRYSLDGGLTWTIMAMDMTAGSLDLTGLPENALVEILPALSN